MTTALDFFAYGPTNVRVAVLDGEPWFAATDVATCLEYRDAHNLTRLLDDDELRTHVVSTKAGERAAVFINEPATYKSITLRQTGAMSNPERAQRIKASQRWVFPVSYTHLTLPTKRIV